jgi:hypothetical protein
MHENKNFFFGRKLGILILDLYLYDIKIHTDINQHGVKNTRENCKIPKNIFEFFPF